MNDSHSPLTEFIAVAALLGLLGLGIICYQQSREIESLKKLNAEQALRIETMERTLLMSR
jgi:hypothetical protein